MLNQLKERAAQEQNLLKNQVKYNLTGSVVMKNLQDREHGPLSKEAEARYLEDLEKILRQDIDRFPTVNIRLQSQGTKLRFNKAAQVMPMPLKSVKQKIVYQAVCPCQTCRKTGRLEHMSFENPTSQKVADV